MKAIKPLLNRYNVMLCTAVNVAVLPPQTEAESLPETGGNLLYVI